jgi:DNA-binding Lrp family transcriptional regulator
MGRRLIEPLRRSSPISPARLPIYGVPLPDSSNRRRGCRRELQHSRRFPARARMFRALKSSLAAYEERRRRKMFMDRYDRQIVAALQDDADRTAEQLSEHVALSPSAIQRRIRRLKQAGIIQRIVAIANPRSLGAPTFFIVSLQVERERPELLAQLRRWLAAEPQVQQAYYVTGDSDFILVVTAPDTESFEALMSRLMTDNANVRRFTTSVTLGLVKRGMSIALPETDL